MTLNFKRTFWYHDPEANFPPPTTQDLEVLSGDEDRICLSVTAQEITSYRRTKLIEEWCRVLPTLKNLRFLWLPLKVPQALFDAACQVPGIEGIWIKWSSIKSLEAFPGQDSFRFFHLGSSTSLESIDVLAERAELTWLELENLKKVRDVGALADLKTLSGLDLSGSMWTTQHVESLSPIGCLDQLRYLSLTNLRSDDKSLRPLYSLRQLESLRLAKWWAAEEIRELERLNPRLAA